MAFDPDQFIASKSQDGASGSFDPDAFIEKANEEKYGGVKGAVGAALIGGLGGATLGATDVLFAKAGIPIKEIKETNPISSFGGEILGTLTPGGPAKLIGKAGKTVYGGLRALKEAKLANEATTAARVLGAAADIGAHAAGSAVEGAIYTGFGKSLNEYALGDPDLNGEKVLDNFGYGALLGGAFGGAIKAASIGLPPAVKGIKDGLTRVRDVAFGTGNKDAGLVGKGLDVVFPGNKLTDAIANRMSRLDQDGQMEVVNKTTDALNDTLRNTQTAIKDLNQKARPAETNILIDTADPKVVKTFQQDYVRKLSGAIEEMNSNKEFYSQGIKAGLDKVHSRVAAALKSSKPSEILNSLNDEVSELYRLQKPRIGMSIEHENAANVVKELYHHLNDSLKNPDIFGMAGAALAEHKSLLNKLFDYIPSPKSKMSDEAREFTKAFMRKAKGGFEFDENKIERMFKKGNTIIGQEKLQRLNDFHDLLNTIPDHLESTYANVPNSTFESKTLRNIVSNSEKTLGESYEKYVSSINNSKNKIGLGDLAAANIAVSHPIVGAALEAYNIATNPIGAMNKLATIERIIGQTTNKIGQGAKAVFTPTIKAIGKVKGPIIKASVPENKERHKKIYEEVSEFKNNPNKLIEHLNASTKDIYDAAPTIAESINAASTRAVEFLASKIPTHTQNDNPFEKSHEPSGMEMAKFERYLNIVEKPTRALDQIKNGTLIPETIETLQFVTPKLYAKMQQELLQEASNRVAKGEVIPYRIKQSISKFLGYPLDQSLMPKNILANQMAFMQAPQPNQPMVKPTQAGMSKITLAERTSTDMHKES